MAGLRGSASRDVWPSGWSNVYRSHQNAGLMYCSVLEKTQGFHLLQCATAHLAPGVFASGFVEFFFLEGGISTDRVLLKDGQWATAFAKTARALFLKKKSIDLDCYEAGNYFHVLLTASLIPRGENISSGSAHVQLQHCTILGEKNRFSLYFCCFPSVLTSSRRIGVTKPPTSACFLIHACDDLAIFPSCTWPSANGGAHARMPKRTTHDQSLPRDWWWQYQRAAALYRRYGER